MYLKILELIAKGEISATELGLPEPAPIGFSLPNDETLDFPVSIERRKAALKIGLARTPAERWQWGMAWREFVLHVYHYNHPKAQDQIEPDPCFVVFVEGA